MAAAAVVVGVLLEPPSARCLAGAVLSELAVVFALMFFVVWSHNYERERFPDAPIPCFTAPIVASAGLLCPPAAAAVVVAAATLLAYVVRPAGTPPHLAVFAAARSAGGVVFVACVTGALLPLSTAPVALAFIAFAGVGAFVLWDLLTYPLSRWLKTGVWLWHVDHAFGTHALMASLLVPLAAVLMFAQPEASPLLAAPLIVSERWLRKLDRQQRMSRAVVAAYAQERAELLRTVVASADRTRQQVLGELHDGPVQVVTAAATLVTLSLEDVEESNVAYPDLLAVKDLLAESVEQMRAILRRDAAAPLRDKSLREAILETVEEAQGAYAGTIHVDTKALADTCPLTDLSVELAAFQIVREALRNAVEHAGASRIEVSCWSNEFGLHVSVADNGSGIDVARAKRRQSDGHLGMVLMRERAAVSGGTVVVGASSSGGTQVSATLPSGVPATTAAVSLPVC